MCLSLKCIIRFAFLNTFSDRWIIPHDTPEENTVDQPRPQQKDALGMRLTVNGTSKFEGK